MKFYLVRLGVFSGIWETERAKGKDIFEKWVQDARAWAACSLLVTGAGLRALWLVPSFRGVFPAFCLPSLLCLWCIALEYAFISRFKGVFRGFWGWYVGLYYLRALRGLCGFCVRE